MTRAGWLGLLLALAACSSPSTPPSVSAANSPATCRVGPDGARPAADRVADRGIGGTGAPQVQTADRGIGGTGIIGVITGFASVCVAGEEVGLPASLPPQIDGKPGSLDDLRAGQVVAMQAAGPAGGLLAREIVVRHVVIGPVQVTGNGMLTVAGQQVVVGDAAGSATFAMPGQFVAVSGFRQPGGVILATRIDPAVPGPVLLRGELIRIYGTTRIGGETVRLPATSNIPGGFPVVVTGRMEGDVLVADSVARDLAEESPAAYFGPAVSNFVVEGYLAVVAGGYFVNRDFVRGGGYGAGPHGRGIATFSRRPEGGLVAQGLRLGGADVQRSPGGRGFTAAPIPRGGFGGPQGFGGGNGPFGPGTQGGQSLGGQNLGGQGFSGPRFQSPDFNGSGNGISPGQQFSPQRR